MRGTLAALMLALLLPLPALAGQVTVKPGETLSEIADRYGISLSRLMSLNGLQRANQVEAGTVLRLPGSTSGVATGTSAGRSGGGMVTVQKGQTLSEIAEQQGISLATLMRINGISDADQVVAGQQLRLSGRGSSTGNAAAGSNASAARGGASVTVQRGQTLSEIAEQQGISLATLMRINGISDPDQVVAGQQLRLPGRNASTGSGGSTVAASYPRNASVHVVRPGESLSGIANGYDLPLSRLVALNAIADPDHVEPGTRLKLQGTPAPRPASTPASRPAADSKGSDKPASVARTTPAAPAQSRATATAATTTSHPHNPVTIRATTATGDSGTTAGTPTHRPSTANAVTASAAQSGVATTGHTALPSQHPKTAAITPAVQAQIANGSGPSVAGATAAAATPAVSSQAKVIATSSTAATNAAAANTGAATGAASSTAATATRFTSSRPANSSVATAGVSTVVPTTTRSTVRSKATASPTVATARADWRTYGPMQVNWTAWQPMGGSMVAPSLNAKGQTFYTAINCGARKLNATTVSGEWQAWSDPSAEFEQQLVTDYCRSRS